MDSDAEATVVRAEGARVQFVPCPVCSAAVMNDPRVEGDALEEHILWHRDGGPHRFKVGDLGGDSTGT